MVMHSRHTVRDTNQQSKIKIHTARDKSHDGNEQSAVRCTHWEERFGVVWCGGVIA